MHKQSYVNRRKMYFTIDDKQHDSYVYMYKRKRNMKSITIHVSDI